MERKELRRRLVQSTLFPHKDSTLKADENGGGDREEPVAEVEEDQEWSASSKKRRGTKRKANSKLKKTAGTSSKKDTENGKETSSKQVDTGSPLVIPKSSFFIKVSEQRQLKRQQNPPVPSDSPEENDEICSVPSSVANGRSTPRQQKQNDESTPRKVNRSSTPKKVKRNSTPSKKTKSGKRELQFDHILLDLPLDEQPLQRIPDLRLEAKMIAEENSRIFSGRQIHPFFTARRGGKTSPALIDLESNWSSGIKEKCIAFNPIHVFENVKDDHSTFSWDHWIFSERSTTNDLQCESSLVYEGSINSLNFDNFLNVSNFTRTSLNQNCHQISVPQNAVSNEETDSHMLPKCTTDILAGCVESGVQDHKDERSFFVDGIHLGGNSVPEFQENLLQDRIMSQYYHTSHNQPQNCLWTDKYRPQNAKQICGNGEPVKFLSEWLHLWHKKGPLIISACTDEDNSTPQDVDYDYQQCESDNDEGEERLKNVLLVTGPVGSGKSAAIYACARDQGFQIIEINASDWRNGALVKQKFGEAFESHWLQRAEKNGTNTENKSIPKLFKAVNGDTQCSDDELVELIHIPDEENLGDACALPKKSVYEKTVNCQNEVKTLILFEEVDASLSEDHGFITTIQQLAVTAKRPMILTSNSDNPALPRSLDRLELSFSLPSVDELLGLVTTICAAEKAKIHPHLLQRFVYHCRGDIRRTIMLLQFWCQGQAPRTVNKQPTTYWPVPFDLDAGHNIIPKIVHWNYPSQLSEFVAAEVVKSLTLMEETKSVMGPIKVDELEYYSTENIRIQKIERDPAEVKKAAILSLLSLDDFECTLFEGDPELFDISCSPVALDRRKSRRKVILSSDSEDEFVCGSESLVSAGPDEPVFQSEVDKLEENCCQLPEIVDYSLLGDTCRSHDMSFMPEMSIVPETEIVEETELFSTTVNYGNFFNGVVSNCISQDQDSIPALETHAGTQPSYILQSDLKLVGSDFDVVTASGYQEEVGDSLSNSEVDITRGFHLLDECSRVDFVRKLKSIGCTTSDQAIDIVKETWKSLQNQCGSLKKYVTAEERSARQVLAFSHGISNLISEGDLLLKDCHMLLSDSLLSSNIPREKTNSYSYHDDQLEMSSVLAQHGMCFYAKEIASVASTVGCQSNLDLASEMLSSSESSVALGKLANQDRRANNSSTETPKSSVIFTRKSDPDFQDILQAVVPSKSYLATKGCAFHEYMSTLSQISRYETSRLSECIDNTSNRRRGRVPRHYLSSGSLAMSSEEISLLGQYINYRKVPSGHLR